MFQSVWLNKAQVRDLYDQALKQVELKRLSAHIHAVIAPSDDTTLAVEEYGRIVCQLHEDYLQTMRGMKDNAPVAEATIQETSGTPEDS